MTIKKLGEKHFEKRVVRETAYGIVDDYGIVRNIMTLQRVNDELMIEWVVGDDLDYSEIGITTVGMDVTGYDGVFEIPKEALDLLVECGFNVDEIKGEAHDKLEKALLDDSVKEYWLIDVTNLNNSWRLIQEIKDSNCNIEKKFIEKENSEVQKR